MNKRQKNEAQAFVRVETWAEGRLGDFQNDPPKKGDAKFVAARAELEEIIGKLGGKAAIQKGGAFGEQTEGQRVLRGEVEDALRGINRDAAAIATELGRPEIMDRFRMPQGSGDAELRTKLVAFADAIEELGLAGAFDELGQEETPESLRAMAVDFQESEGGQGEALGEQAGATAMIPDLIRAGRAQVKILHSVVNNRYRDNAEVLGAWKTVSRVQRNAEPAPEPPVPIPA